jgi:large subunit ribosomal protein L25
MNGIDTVAIAAKPLELRPIIYTSQAKLVNLQIEGDKETKQCFLKDSSFDPLTEQLIHFDLIGITEGHTISVDLPVVLKGQAKGVREGGVLQQNMHKVRVDCLPADLPEDLEIDVSDLAIGKALHIKDFSIPHLKFEAPPDTVIVSVVPPRVIKEDAPKETAEAATDATAAATATTAAATPAAMPEKGKKGKEK